jgi:integrase
MATGKITLSSIAQLSGWLWDTTVNGFGARRQTKGVFYYLRYRRDGSQFMRSIGRHGSPWTPDTARTRALELLGILAGGSDPFTQPLTSEAFGAAVDRYLERKRGSIRPRTFAEDERYLRNHASSLHRLKLGEIDRRAIATVLAEIERSSGPASRNRSRATLSSFFAWAITEGLLDANPVTGTAKANENSRDRVLTTDELRKLWLTLADANQRFADIIRLLLLTAQRRDEIGKLQWSEIDYSRKLIVFPPARTKNRREHSLPLSHQALEILERQPHRNTTPFLFSEANGFRDWDKGKERLDRRLQIAPWRLHDLRRTCATGMAELGIQPHIIEAILNHVSGHKAGVAGIYNRARYEGEMRMALTKWADYIDQITV